MTELATTVREAAGRTTISQRKNIPQVLEWMNNHERDFPSYIQAFDTVIVRHNTGVIPPENTCQQEAKATFHAPFPPIESLSPKGGVREYVRLIRAMRKQDELMKRGEEIMKEKGEGKEIPKEAEQQPHLKYHIEDTVKDDPEAVFVGSLFHLYEEFIAKMFPYSGARRDLVVDALIESLIYLHAQARPVDPPNPLYDPVTNSGRLNWVNGYTRFSEKFLTRYGFDLPKK